eukprot:TRINITY_DN1515_c0_g1_i5.p15 TRINITY_DN1515_c0_g1~~TRINITY_DN1515_c0_g1_i5.p15  ORF type:complete len:117 (+),score=14.83 TRINITY_DN1515_c0_g1_i5:229-579(+)
MNACSHNQNGSIDMSLDLTKAREMAQMSKQTESDEENGPIVTIHLTLPGGESKEMKIRQGYQVVYVKALLSEEYGYPMKALSLWLDGKQMLDPLSLADYPDVKPGETTQVTVKVEQ